ncbi:MAG TPA: HD domain-containing phosphohydrolase [Burkholderiales bacterium]|nr:HD domain-containing phosphohydrolase [Burkholderiales bacterium]
MGASIDGTQGLRFPAGAAATAADDVVQRLDQLNAIGASLSAERDINRLLEAILTAAKTITRADGGTLYRLTEEKSLRFEIVRTSSLKYYLGGTTGNPVPFYPIQLYKDGRPNQTMVAAQAALTGKTINIADAYTAEGFDFTGTRAFDAKTGYRSKSFLTVPMRNHEGATIGVLQLINAQEPGSGQIVPFSASDQRLAESLASQAAVALTNRILINQLESLFESFIGLINGAIDEKSPYTGGHCQRVPMLTMMLAEAVNETTEGPLAQFRMTDKDRYELKIAGLLHDCGKVTTPVHVVDKATKLETIFDRVQLIDTRFEVLKRDLEIESLKRRAGMRPMEAAEDEARLRDQLRRLDEDRKFLHACNIGSERMRDEDIEHVKRIARYRWRDVSGHEADFLTSDEVRNLTIRAGTLTEDERKIINHHIVATIKMLEALPWPKHLTNVPEYAGGHHERMDGKGYPRGLTREQMSVQARCMGIADIFEALTAKDRPYKKGKTLSESLEILGRMKQNQHIDPDLFDVFVRRKVYRRYAEMFLDKEQIDEVDESRIPGYTP